MTILPSNVPRRGIRLLLPTLLLAWALGLASAPAAAAAGIFPYDAHVESLENGLKVILVPMPAEGLVTYWSIVRTGARDEYEPGHTGFAHFFEHMMFRGTEKFPQDVYNDMVTRMGADANAYTTDDLTAYHLGIAAEDLELFRFVETAEEALAAIDNWDGAGTTRSEIPGR